MLANLMQNPGASALVGYYTKLVGFCTILGTIIAILEFIKRGKKKVIIYSIDSTERTGYDTYSTKIILWNSGNDPLKREDIASLTISASGTGRISSAVIEKQNEKSNMFSVKTRDGKAIVDFKYMNKNQGAVVKVYHTGSANKISFDCKIIGGGVKAKKLDPNIDDDLLFLSTCTFIFGLLIDLSWAIVTRVLPGADPVVVASTIVSTLLDDFGPVVFVMLVFLAIMGAALVLIIISSVGVVVGTVFAAAGAAAGVGTSAVFLIAISRVC